MVGLTNSSLNQVLALSAVKLIHDPVQCNYYFFLLIILQLLLTVLPAIVALGKSGISLLFFGTALFGVMLLYCNMLSCAVILR